MHKLQFVSLQRNSNILRLIPATIVRTNRLPLGPPSYDYFDPTYFTLNIQYCSINNTNPATNGSLKLHLYLSSDRESTFQIETYL